jgi:hypothetical protein
MRALISVLVVLASASCALTPQAPIPTPALAWGAGYEPLSSFIGRWTLKGDEDTYVETCGWYEGGFHIICHTENKRSDGSVGKGMSILGYLPDKDSYTYHGIGSKGRNETMIGTFRGGIFEFNSEGRENGRVVKARVRMGPFIGREIPFTAETSIDGAPWVMDATITYVRLD